MTMPQMGAAFQGWQTRITLSKVTQEIVDGFVEETTESVSFMGVVQPLSPKAVELKPEGQRAFEWLQIHCFSGQLNLDVKSIITYDCKKYKIMKKLDYKLNNFVEYHAIEDYYTPIEDQE